MGRFTAALGAVLLVASPLAASPSAADEPPPAGSGTIVIVTQATEACFTSAIRITGFLVPRNEAIVSFDLEGYQVSEILVSTGDRVTLSQPVIRLSRIGGDTPAAPAQQGQSQQPPLAPTILLRAPADGRVTKSGANVGAVVSPRGEPLLRIAVDNEIEVDAEVPGLYLADIAPGQAVRIAAVGKDDVLGSVRLVASEIDRSTQLGHVRISVGSDASLRPGGFVRATIDARRSCGVSVPRAAVLYGSDGTSVQVVRGRIVETKKVRVGLLSDRNAEILEGVRNGDIIVANAGTSLRDGDQVTTITADDSNLTGSR